MPATVCRGPRVGGNPSEGRLSSGPPDRLFATDEEGEQVHTMRLCHAPYRLRPARVTAWGDARFALAGVEPPGREPEHRCAAQPVDVEVFLPEKME